MRPTLTRVSRQRGLTLMEVLVSMLVMALGLLGIAALQTTTLRYQQGSSQRAAVGGLLADFSERVRANLGQTPGVLGVGTSPYVLSGTWANLSALALPTPKACSGVNVTCTPAELAADDMAKLRAAARQQLPQGTVAVGGDARTGMTVTFMWRDKEFNAQSSAGVLSARTSTQCAASTTGIDQQSCCPQAIAAPAGVRCANFTVTP